MAQTEGEAGGRFIVNRSVPDRRARWRESDTETFRFRYGSGRGVFDRGVRLDPGQVRVRIAFRPTPRPGPAPRRDVQIMGGSNWYRRFGPEP
jgi:hypothetical protein